MKRLVILGGGESGVGAAILGKQKGYEVFVSDSGSIAKKYKKVLLHHEINFEEHQHSEPIVLNADLVVKSPGIPDNVPIVRDLTAKKVSVISEIEFASYYTNATIIGITGSNGKTTTSLITNHLLKAANLNVGIAGNIGRSFAQQVSEQNFDSYVIELSSFQLDGIINFRPHIAMITNISPDHLDRYANDFNKYVASKFRITKNQTKDDFLIYDADDVTINKWIKNHKIKAQLIPFSIQKEVNNGAFLKEDTIVIKLNKEEFSMSISNLKLQGKHNVKNTMAGALASQLLNVRSQSIKDSLANFEGAEHRLENVQKVNGVQFINDSKATNVNATFYALECMEQSTVWIVGGVDKGNDYEDLLPLVREKVKAIVCLGEDNEKLKAIFYNVVDMMIETAGAEEAVKVAYKLSQPGDTVLLSPACASFDLFENYEDRGRQFKSAVRSL
ncbi:UDP-N-acetylmuramoyl-L-alanine--D-glutamate ligase [Flavobacteriaceae bacterium]|nr:UDP-N-acetylmuramoyl-L-alanine--D-glutamate ligase [Flavobacteriaceae bacterium]MDB2491139.1 UDP-N-acetylmuramoyl-L-alanine--D-glutamate ligase [Flavobacteriaceae bacterium]MDB2625465.1 UDP-N-acetylmuramoyl-L-alanine--D-glutamate ligase [Flavobacteriaceae bacterium]